MLSPLLPLGFTPEAPVAYEANNFSRNHIKQTRCSIDCKNDIIHPLLSALYFPRQRSKVGERIFTPERSSFMEMESCQCSFPPVLGPRPPSNNYVYVHAHEHLHYRGFCSGIEVSILVCQRQGRQSMRQLHQSAKSVWKSLSHTQAELMNMRLRVCVGKTLVGGDVKSERAFGCAYFQPYKMFLFHMKF